MKQLSKLLLLSFVLLWTGFSQANISIASFNIQNLGWNNNKDFHSLAHIINHFDIVAIQELMNEQGIKDLQNVLNQNTEYDWNYLISHPIGRGSYEEKYAFIWNNNVDYVDGAVVYIDNRDVFAREPYSAKFQSQKTGTTFALSNIHVIFGDSVSDRQQEIKALSDYWDWLQDTYEQTPIIMAGDFNLSPNHSYFESFVQNKATPLITDVSTTISPIDNRYASLYDNLFVNLETLDINQTGAMKFPTIFNISHEKARDTISDHIPVYLTLGNKTITFTNLDNSVIDRQQVEDALCVNINESTKNLLTDIPNIGPARAIDIIEGRPWGRIEELSRITGVGAKTVQSIKEYDNLCEI